MAAAKRTKNWTDCYSCQTERTESAGRTYSNKKTTTTTTSRANYFKHTNWNVTKVSMKLERAIKKVAITINFKRPARSDQDALQTSKQAEWRAGLIYIGQQRKNERTNERTNELAPERTTFTTINSTKFNSISLGSCLDSAGLAWTFEKENLDLETQIRSSRLKCLRCTDACSLGTH